MNEAWRVADPSKSVGAEAPTIAALETALAGLDSNRDDERGRSLRNKLYRELFEARGQRIDRCIAENWSLLETLVGRKVRE